MNDSARAQREIDLVAYYDNEVHHRADRELPAQRVALRKAYLELLEGEGRRSVLEIGAGPGRDGKAFAAAGLAYTGIDLAPESVAACRSLDLDAHVASVLNLPFERASFEAGWSMSTLLHVADEDLDTCGFSIRTRRSRSSCGSIRPAARGCGVTAPTSDRRGSSASAPTTPCGKRSVGTERSSSG